MDEELTEEENELLQSEEVSAADDSQITSGNELLDATQNAIIDAAENVSEVLTLTEKPQQPVKEESIPLYMDVEFWVGMSFVLVVLMVAKPVWKRIKNMLRGRIDAVIKQINDAVQLRDDAQKLLADYEKRCNDLNYRVAEISEQTQKSIQIYREQELKNLQKDLNKKQTEVEARIERATQNAKDEINASVSSLAVELARKTIENHLNKEDKIRLIDEAVSELDKLKKA